MTMLITILNTERIDDRLWKTTLEPMNVRSLTNESKQTEDVSVIFLNDVTDDNGSIQFKPESVRVLSVGRTNKVYFIETTPDNNTSPRSLKVEFSEISSGESDKEFTDELNKVPHELKKLGLEFIAIVRKNFKGNLKSSKSKRFIESPDNFWTVKIQPRAMNLAITVRGKAEQFKVPEEIELKDDRQGYSIFRIEKSSEIQSAMEIIRQSEQLS